MLVCAPSSEASRVTVILLTGAEGLNFDFAIFSFQVPSVLSAANAPMTVIAKPASSLVRMLLIKSPFGVRLQCKPRSPSWLSDCGLIIHPGRSCWGLLLQRRGPVHDDFERRASALFDGPG